MGGLSDTFTEGGKSLILGTGGSRDLRALPVVDLRRGRGSAVQEVGGGGDDDPVRSAVFAFEACNSGVENSRLTTAQRDFQVFDFLLLRSCYVAEIGLDAGDQGVIGLERDFAAHQPLT